MKAPRPTPLFLALLPFLAAPVQAMPRYHGGGEPHPESVGTPLLQRLAQKQGGIAAGLSHGTDVVYPATVKILLLKVDFPADTTTTTTGTGEWTDCTASCNGNPDYWVDQDKQHMVDYYTEVSGGLLTLQVDVSPTVYRMPNPMASYGHSDSLVPNLVRDAVAAADPHVNFGRYDAILIVHAGSGEESDLNGDSPDDIWSLYYSGLSNITSNEGPVTEAIVMPQTGSQDGEVLDPLGVYVHEFGHWLGLPDLYCTSPYSCPFEGIGMWGLMDSGAWNGNPAGSQPAQLSAWSKADLGWVTVQEVASNADLQSLSLDAVETSPAGASATVAKIPAGANTNRYFLVENRQPIGFDAGLPGSGLLVWQIDPDVIARERANNSINNTALFPGVKLIEADGDNEMSHGGLGSAGDPFPGSSHNTRFTPYTTPSSSTIGQPGWLYLENIPDSGDPMAFTASFAPAAPASVAASVTCNSAAISWNAVTQSDLRDYRVYRDGTLLTETTALTYTDTNPTDGTQYAVSSVDTGNYESGGAVYTVQSVPSCSNSGGGSGSSACFIATAAFGSPMAEEVNYLRAFRDRFLRTNKLGRRFVAFYYRKSPPIADYIREREHLRALVRVGLYPLITMSRLLLRWRA